MDYEAEKGTALKESVQLTPVGQMLKPLSIESWRNSERLQRKRRKVRAGSADRAANMQCACQLTMSVEINPFKKLCFFPFHLIGLFFFLLKYSFRRAMLQLEFGESKSDESLSEQFITETRKAASCSSEFETLKSNAGSGPAAAGCPISNPDNLWKGPLLSGCENFFELSSFGCKCTQVQVRSWKRCLCIL